VVNSLLIIASLLASVLVAACSEPVSVEVNIVEPCNQMPLEQLDYLRFIPKGQDIDSQDLTSVYPVNKPFATPIPMPLAPDFQLLVTGHRETYSSPMAGIGMSPITDLMAGAGLISIDVPFALVDEFYRTTNFADSAVCTEMENPRVGASATFLPDQNKVLIVGGMALGQAAPKYRRVVEMYDPASGLFSKVGELKVELARAYHSANLLNDGRVLIAGGISEQGVTTESVRTALIIEPKAGSARVTISSPVNMRKPRSGHKTVQLADGRIILLGGRQLNSAAALAEDHTYLADVEIYDPKDGQFISPADPGTGNLVEMSVARYGHSAVVLPNGKDILIAGGFNADGPQASIDILNVSGTEITLTATASTQAGPIFLGAALVSEDSVLLSGGYGEVLDADPQGRAEVTTVERSSKRVEIWRFAEEFRGGPTKLVRLCQDEMTRERGHHTASITGRRALFIGGHSVSGATTNTAEIVYLADNQGGKCFAQTPTLVGMSESRARHTATVLPSGELLVIGGLSQTNDASQSITSAEIFSPARSIAEFQ
jgi:large repetitive protein